MHSLSPPLRAGLAALVLGSSALAQTAAPASAATPPAPAPTAAPASAASAASASDDPYLWLEKVDSPEALDWVRAENRKTLSVLEKDPRFERFHEEALAIAETKDRIPSPSQIGGRVYNFWQDAEHVRGLWRVTTPADYDAGRTPHWKSVLDLDAVARAEHANWVWEGADCEHRQERRCMISLSDGGEDAVTVREFDLQKGAFVAKGFELPKGKQRATWADADTLLVSREWNPGELTTSGYPFIVKQLKRGQPLAAAKEIFRGRPSDGGYGVEPHTFVDAAGHRALTIERPLSTFESEKYLVTAEGVRRLALPAKADMLELYDGQLLVRIGQDWQAGGDGGGVAVREGTLVAIDLAQATAHPDSLKPVVVYAPGPRQSLGSVAGTKDALVVTTLDNVRGRAALYTRAGDGRWKSVPLALPDNATVRVVDTDPRSAAAYLSTAGYLQPSTLWRVDTPATRLAQVRALPAQFDASRSEVEQYEATSSDGTKIPYFIVHPKHMKLDGGNPTILYAYGGFDVSLSPNYIATTGKLWLEQGGVYVVANIRGGGEFGPAWHEAGLKTRRQIIYDDFVAVARDLVARNVTSPRRLGIMGGSNGGLLMGVQMTQHPELWNAVDIQVPLLDMLRFEQIAAGTSWVGEYGSVSVPEERAFLAKISPYNQLRRDTKYPRALIWTTTKDDRVGPQHARKFAARLSEYGVPYYYYEVIEGGHGAGANLKERAHTSALEYTYFARQLMDQ
jgi:prolyl oligopeptidase